MGNGEWFLEFTESPSTLVLQALKRLSYREREIIKFRYGLGDGYRYTLEEVGHIFKVPRERVRRIEGRALERLRELLKPFR